MIEDNIQEGIKQIGDVIAGGVSVSVVMQWLTPVAALFTIVYTGLRIYEWYKKS